MILHKSVHDLDYFQFVNLSNYKGLKHFVTTHNGGISKPPFDSLNLGLKVADTKDAVIHNRHTLASVADVNIDYFVIPSQCHSNNIQIVDEKNRGMGVFDKADAISDTDALVSITKGICLMIFAADCVPVLFFDPVQKVIAAAHAGWKGTVNKIVQDVVFCMSENFGTNPKDIIAGIGPSIGPCCYNVGDEVILKVNAVFSEMSAVLTKIADSNEVYFDLWQANKINLTNAGVQESNIEIAELCTFCHSDLFFSHRKSGGNTGRFGAGIILQ